VTGGAGADVVYDPVGGAHTEAALRATAWNGRLLVIGFTAGDIPRVPTNLVLLKGCAIVGVFWGMAMTREPARGRAQLAEILGCLKDGSLRPHVHATYPLSRALDALRDVAQRRVQGKAVITVGGEA
jgi:NADPH2:quinone reductase